MRINPKSEPADAATSIGATKRRHRSKLERRGIVEETLVPGASVALIARKYDVNANQVFHWRKLYREGLLVVETPPTQFLPARIVESSHVEGNRTGTTLYGEYTGVIDIEFGGARVRITGSADPGCVRAALEQLRR